MIGSEVVERVDHFTYLGSLISPCGLLCDEISARIQKARLALANLHYLWLRRDIRLPTKGRVYCAPVHSVLLYGSETWPMVVGGSRQETLNLGFVLLGTHQQDVPVILRELMLSDGFDPVSPSFTVEDVNTGLSGRRLTSYRTEMYSQLIDQCHMYNHSVTEKSIRSLVCFTVSFNIINEAFIQLSR
ncbi:unnamed protein product [Schistosoma mattheei]|uniref:Uncharacterized protein n=1 Tax=Schistosoma mattheei TaxID=31246 RepID=A0A183PC98_9TREM|nr:unnamed protein product [Schistosoma mattheei]